MRKCGEFWGFEPPDPMCVALWARERDKAEPESGFDRTLPEYEQAVAHAAALLELGDRELRARRVDRVAIAILRGKRVS